MENRRFLLALSLSVLVLVGWQYLFAPEPPAPREGREPISERAVEGPSAEPATVATGPEPEPAPAPEAAPGAPTEVEARPDESAESEERVVVERGSFRAELTNRGAQLVSFRLLDHPASDGGVVDLVRARAGGPYPFAVRLPGGKRSPLDEALFVVERWREGEGEAVELRYSGPAGRAVKRFVFHPSGLFDLFVEVAGGGELLLGPGIRNPGADELANRFTRRSVLYRTAEDIERLDPVKASEPRQLPAGTLRWVGLEDTYFLTALVLRSPVARVEIEPMLARSANGVPAIFEPLPIGRELTDEEKELSREVQIAVALEGERLEAAAYFGPKEYRRLASLPYDLEESVNLGVFAVLAKPLLWGLRWIHGNVVGNYGWAIILMTVLIRLVLFPLTHKSFVSMQKMQELNPQLQAIRQKYRPKLKDKQGRPNPEMQRKMNEEIMALYKKEGVNPAGGCLPMLLQIPVLFAFYSLLSTAIELRHAPWIFWITDLSAKDPYYALPIIMGASQFVQQRLTPTSADPAQRRIFMMMPIFFTVLFLGFPSGLVLYWLTNNVLGIAQQTAYKKLREGKAGAPSPSSPQRKKGSRS